MLGKLIKHEFKATSRTFGLLYLATLVLTLINKAFVMVNVNNDIFDIFRTLFLAMYVAIIVALSIVTFVLILMRFYKNLLGDEGYLSFTLPVTPGQHIISKLIAGTVWFLASILVICISVLLLLADKNTFSTIGDFLKSTFELMGSEKILIMVAVQIFILMILAVINQLLVFYASMAFGQMLTKHRVLGGVVAYFVISMVVQIISSIGLVVMTLIRPNILTEELSIKSTGADICTILIFCNVLYIVLAVVYYYGCRYALKNKLNLE